MNHMFNNVWCFKFNKRIAFIQFTLQYAERDADINGFTTVPVHAAVENACIIFPAATQDKAMFFQTSFCMTKTKSEKTWLCPGRSEEHTSELQSRFDLVCRLLLEKKKENEERG